MNIKECYERLNGSYEDAKSRLMTDDLITKFVMKFPQDDTMTNIKAAMDNADWEGAFRGAHTLKGVAGNLGFTALAESASELTEQLRGGKIPEDVTLWEKVEGDYKLVIETISEYCEET